MLLTMDRAGRREALHVVLVHKRSQHLNMHGLVIKRMSRQFQLVKKKKMLQFITIEHVQRTVHKNKHFFHSCAFSFVPQSSSHAQLSMSVSTATFAKRASCRRTNSAANQSSARTSFQDEYGKAGKRQDSALLKNTQQKTSQTEEATVLPC